MKAILVISFISSLLLVGCGSGTQTAGTETGTSASTVAGAPNKQAAQTQTATFGGPGAKNSASIVGSKGGK